MQKLVLIHGALGSDRGLVQIANLLAKDYEVINYALPGHGSRSNELAKFQLKAIVADLESLLDTIGEAYVFGFSMGGYIAMALAQNNCPNILGIVTLGTKLNWSVSIAERESRMLQLAFMQEKAPAFYKYLHELHGENLAFLFTPTAQLMQELGNDPLISAESVAKIKVPVHCTRGGKDSMVTKAETMSIVDAIPLGQYFEIPNWSHPIGFLNPRAVARHIQIQIAAMQNEYLVVGAHTIAIRKIGEWKANQPTLVFLHEALGGMAQWKSFPGNLSQAMQLPGLLIEMPGYGFSSAVSEKRNNRYLHDFAWEILPAILEKLNLQQDLILVGHSDGGTEALLFAARYSHQVKAVITLAAHIKNETETRAGITPVIAAYQAGKLENLGLYHREKTEKLFYDWADTWLSEDFVSWNIAEDIKGTEVPALILQGDTDQYGTAAQVHEIVGCLGDLATPCFIVDCGHSPHISHQKEVMEQITAWWYNTALQKEKNRNG